MALADGQKADPTQRRTHQTIHLTEYATTALPHAALDFGLGERLWQRYGKQIQVDFPSPRTSDQWQLTPLGWVGSVPLTRNITLSLAPRIPLANLFGMLEYAWRLRSFHILDGMTQSATMPAFYERLAYIFAQRVLALVQRGLYPRYEPRTARRETLRGRLDVAELARQPWQANLPSRYHEQTIDCTENRILLWTLHGILRSRLCSERVAPTIRRAHRALQRMVTLTPCPSDAADAWDYHRLNNAYRPLHALCRFFLHHTGPSIAEGDAPMIPFLVNMARLFELFVAEWLAAHMPTTLMLWAQEFIPIVASTLTFVADGVIRDRATGAPRCVFDTKYTTAAEPATDDVAQVVAYANALHCPRALLIYPQSLTHPLDAWIGDIHVQSATFALAADLASTGDALLRYILPDVGKA